MKTEKKEKYTIPSLEYTVKREYPQTIIDLIKSDTTFKKHKEECDFAKRDQFFVRDANSEDTFSKDENKPQEDKKQIKQETQLSGHYIAKESFDNKVVAQCGCGLRMILNDKGGVDLVDPNAATSQGASYSKSKGYMAEKTEKGDKQYA